MKIAQVTLQKEGIVTFFYTRPQTYLTAFDQKSLQPFHLLSIFYPWC